MTVYVAEQRQPDGRVARREVIADGYVWSQAGVVSFTRQSADDGTTRHTTFATLYDCLLVAEAGSVDPIGEERAG